MLLLASLMKSFVKVGTFTIVDVDGKSHVFKGIAGPEVTIRLKDRKLYRTLFLRVCSRIGESRQSSCHEFDHGGLDKGQAGLCETLDIL